MRTDSDLITTVNLYASPKQYQTTRAILIFYTVIFYTANFDSANLSPNEACAFTFVNSPLKFRIAELSVG